MAKTKTSLPKQRRLTLAQQKFLIGQRFPQFRFSKTRETWVGQLSPTLKSPKYIIRIIYKEYGSPKVYVVKPEIVPNCPHIYRDGSLCLYYPGDNSWNQSKSIATTIIPWTAEWLFFYEGWLATGFWYGPEAKHTGAKI